MIRTEKEYVVRAHLGRGLLNEVCPKAERKPLDSSSRQEDCASASGLRQVRTLAYATNERITRSRRQWS
jgi:hypothetical protein